MKRRDFIKLASVAGVSLVSGCYNVNLPKKTLVLSLGSDPVTLNPILASDSASFSVIDFLFNGLITVDEDQNIRNDIAKDIEILENGLLYRVHMRDDVRFHDNYPLSADDVVFTYQKILEPTTNTVRRSDFVVNGKAVEVIKRSQFVVDFVLPEVFSPFKSNLGIGILPKHILEGKDINTDAFNSAPIGTGPFKLKSWHTADRVSLEANDSYFEGKPLLDSMIMRIIPDPNSAVFSYESGEIDMVDLRPKDVVWIESDKDSKVVSYPARSYTYLGFNLKNALFRDKSVRVAIAQLIDKPSLVKAVLRGYGEPLNYPTCPLDWSYPEGLPYPAYNVQGAIDILEHSGWHVGASGLRQKDGVEFRFTCLIRQGSKEREMAGIIIQQYLERAGIKMDILNLEWGTLISRLTSKKKDFDATIMGWGLGIDPDPYGIWYSGEYPDGFNFVGYSNEEVDRLIVLARQTVDVGERKSIYRSVYQHIVEDQPYVFLWYPQAIEAYRTWVKGLSRPTPSGLLVHPERVYLERD